MGGRIARIGGMLLQISSFGFLAYVLYVNVDRLRAAHVLRPGVLVLLVVLTAASVTMLVMLVVGWRALLSGAGREPVSFTSAFWVIGRTAIAKYLPGNVFQYIGRQFFGNVLSADQQTIFAATLGEVMIVASISCLTALLCLPFASLPDVPPLARVAALGVLLAGACSPLVVRLIASRLPARRPFNLLQPMLRISAPFWVRSFLGYGICLSIGAAIFLVACRYFAGAFEHDNLATLAAAYSISYAFGFMLPGAPGGLGVREAMIALLATGFADQSLIVTAALVQRMSSILAEALCFGASFVITPANGPASPPS